MKFSKSKGIAVLSAVFTLLFFQSSALADSDILSDIDAIELSQEEQAWLDENHIVTIGVDNWQPYSIVDESKSPPVVEGVSIEYIQTIFNFHNINYEYVLPSQHPFAECLDLIGKKETVDMLAAAAVTEQRKKDMLFTQGYVQSPWVIFTRDDAPFISSLDDLDGKTVAVPKSYAIMENLQEDYPNINLLVIDGDGDLVAECIEKLESSEADAFIGNLTVGSYTINHYGYKNIKVAAPTPFDLNEVSIAVRSDWPELVSIVNKTLDAMTLEEHSQIESKWLNIGYDYRMRWNEVILYFLGGSIIFLLIILLSLRRNKILEEEVTFHKELEEISRKRFLQTMRSANIGLWNYYPQQDKIEVNDVWCTQLGYQPDELREGEGEWAILTGGTSKWLELMHPDDKKGVAKRLHGYFSRSIDDYSVEFRLRCKNGKYLWVLGSGSISKYDKQGNPIQMDGVHISVDEIKKAQEEMEISKQKAEEASKVKGEFLANMSHEIRTPMNAVIGLSDLLSKTNLTAKQRYFVEKLDQSSKNLLNIINEILDFSKLESGKLPIENVEFRIDNILQNLSTLISHRAFEKNLELLIYRDPDIPNVLVGDPYRLNQVLLNLVGNAVKFTSEGEVLVVVELLSDDDKVKLRFVVTDTGIGMTESEMEKLFTAFQQADASTTRKYGGTGLGLAISKNIVNLMGSDIEVTSEIDVGSQFKFELEFEKASKYLHSELELPESIKHLKIMAVEDNLTARFIMKNYLTDFENEPLILSSGTQALQAFDKAPYDLVILDCEMGDMNGIQTWHRLKLSKNYTKNTKAILISSYEVEEVDKRAHEAGFNQVLTKPVTKSSLYNTIMDIYSVVYKPASSKNEVYIPDLDKIRGAKILLVEDDKINQLVAKEILCYESFDVDVAQSGASAIEMARIVHYDLILMDLQMPVMDGYQATKIIKSKITSSVPIIALTADVLSGVKQKVIDAGMDGYLSKPIDKTQLFNTLVKWIKPKHREIKKTMDKYDDNITADYIIENLKDADAKEGLGRLSNNINLYITLLKKYTDKYSNFFEELNNDIAQQQYQKAAKDAHSLKGVTGNLSMNTLRELLIIIQHSLENEDIKAAANAINKAKVIHKRILSQIDTIVS